MSELVNIGAVIFAGFIHASLQLGLSGLVLLYHESAGKYVRKKTRRLVDSYIAGVGTIVLLGLCAVCFLLVAVFGGVLPLNWLAVTIGALFSVAIVIWTIYYRRGRTTELWLPKTIARYINARAKETKSDTEAFTLGILTCFAETPFIIFLMIVSANSLMAMGIEHQLLMVAIYTVIAISPLIATRMIIRKGETAVGIQKWRVKNKTFIRVLSGTGFVVLAIYLIVFGMVG